MAFSPLPFVTERPGPGATAPGTGKPREGMNMKTFIKMLKDQSGASAAEYALILAIVGTAIALAAILLGDTISAAMNDASTCISSNGTNCV
jgi:pilus assembly protein Flp/PilA